MPSPSGPCLLHGRRHARRLLHLHLVRRPRGERNTATATVINNAATATTLNGTGGDDILIANNGTETLNGGGGNDVLFGNSGSHIMTGGAGNDTFAFMHTTDGTPPSPTSTIPPSTIGLPSRRAGWRWPGGRHGCDADVPVCGDDQFNGLSGFPFDTANQTLYFSADGTQVSALALAHVQAGVTINPHDVLVV